MLPRVSRCLGRVVDSEGGPAAPPGDGEEKTGATANVEESTGGLVALNGVEPALVKLDQRVRRPVVIAEAVIAQELGHRALSGRVELLEELADLFGVGQGPEPNLSARPAPKHMEPRQAIENLRPVRATDQTVLRLVGCHRRGVCHGSRSTPRFRDWLCAA